MVQSEIHKQIFEFLKELKEANYSIGPDDLLRIEKLLISLAAVDQLPKTISGYQFLLAPLLCTSEVEQFDFHSRFENWCNQHQTDTSSESRREEVPLKPELQSLRREQTTLNLQRIFSFLIAAAGLAIPALMQLQPADPTTPGVLKQDTAGPLVSSRSFSPMLIIMGIVLLAALTFIIYQVLRLRQRDIFLRRLQTRNQTSIRSFFVKGIVEQLFQQSSISMLSAELRKHIPIDNAHLLNVDATVEKTIDRGGFFSPVFDNVMERPEYLVLIDKSSERDNGASFTDSLVNKLAARDVTLVKYYFNKDPRSSYAAMGNSNALTLEQLHIVYPNHRVVIFSHANYFVDNSKKKVKPWVETFARWEKAFFVTPALPENWGAAENIMINKGLVLLPENEQGLFSLVTRKQFSSSFEPDSNEIIPEEILTNRLWQGIGNLEPGEEEIKRVFADLKFFLGYNGTKWLSACAIYPELNLELTIYLGHNLKGLNGRMLYDRTLLQKIIQLPWFKLGKMPDWMRAFLIERMNVESQRDVRLVLQKLILTASEIRIGKFELPYAVEKTDLVYLLLDSFKRLQKDSPDTPLADQIFLSYMDDRLAVQIPKAIKTFFTGDFWTVVTLSVLSVVQKLGDWLRSQFAVTLRQSIGVYVVTLLACLGIYQAAHYSIVEYLAKFLPAPVAYAYGQIYLGTKNQQLGRSTNVALGTLTSFIAALLSLVFVVGLNKIINSHELSAWVDNFFFVGVGETVLEVVSLQIIGVSIYGLLISWLVSPFTSRKNANSSVTRFQLISIVIVDSIMFILLDELVFLIADEFNMTWLSVSCVVLPLAFTILSAHRAYILSRELSYQTAVFIGLLITSFAILFEEWLDSSLDITRLVNRPELSWWLTVAISGAILSFVTSIFTSTSYSSWRKDVWRKLLDYLSELLSANDFKAAVNTAANVSLLTVAGIIFLEKVMGLKPFTFSPYVVLLVILPLENIFISFFPAFNLKPSKYYSGPGMFNSRMSYMLCFFSGIGFAFSFSFFDTFSVVDFFSSFGQKNLAVESLPVIVQELAVWATISGLATLFSHRLSRFVMNLFWPTAADRQKSYTSEYSDDAGHIYSSGIIQPLNLFQVVLYSFFFGILLATSTIAVLFLMEGVVPPDPNFFVVCLILLIAGIYVAFRTTSLRLRNNMVKLMGFGTLLAAVAGGLLNLAFAWAANSRNFASLVEVDEATRGFIVIYYAIAGLNISVILSLFTNPNEPPRHNEPPHMPLA